MEQIEIHFRKVKSFLLNNHHSHDAGAVTRLIKRGIEIGKYPKGFLEFIATYPKKTVLRNRFSGNFKLKNFINSRDDHECQRMIFGIEKCRSKRTLEIHHIKPIKTHPKLTMEPSNLILLCRKCHRGVESGKLRL